MSHPSDDEHFAMTLHSIPGNAAALWLPTCRECGAIVAWREVHMKLHVETDTLS